MFFFTLLTSFNRCVFLTTVIPIPFFFSVSISTGVIFLSLSFPSSLVFSPSSSVPPPVPSTVPNWFFSSPPSTPALFWSSSEPPWPGGTSEAGTSCERSWRVGATSVESCGRRWVAGSKKVFTFSLVVCLSPGMKTVVDPTCAGDFTVAVGTFGCCTTAGDFTLLMIFLTTLVRLFGSAPPWCPSLGAVPPASPPARKDAVSRYIIFFLVQDVFKILTHNLIDIKCKIYFLKCMFQSFSIWFGQISPKSHLQDQWRFYHHRRLLTSDTGWTVANYCFLKGSVLGTVAPEKSVKGIWKFQYGNFVFFVFVWFWLSSSICRSILYTAYHQSPEHPAHRVQA